jgi:hypothetical protein
MEQFVLRTLLEEDALTNIEKKWNERVVMELTHTFS